MRFMSNEERLAFKWHEEHYEREQQRKRDQVYADEELAYYNLIFKIEKRFPMNIKQTSYTYIIDISLSVLS